MVKCMEAWKAELMRLVKPFMVLTDYKNLAPFMTKRKLIER